MSLVAKHWLLIVYRGALGCKQRFTETLFWSCRYSAHVADWASDGSLYAFAARNAVVLVQPAEHRCSAVLSAHTNRQAG